MNKTRKVGLWILGFLLIVFVGLAIFTRLEAHKLVTHPLEEREPIDETPGDYGLPFEDVTVAVDGLQLKGW